MQPIDPRRALATLPPRQRAVIVLRVYENQTEEQIAETLGISRRTDKPAGITGVFPIADAH